MADGHRCHDSCDHNHDHEAPERGQQYSLYLKIDLLNVECLNEARDGSGKDVFKPWEERLSTEKVCKLFINNLVPNQSPIPMKKAVIEIIYSNTFIRRIFLNILYFIKLERAEEYNVDDKNILPT